MRVYLFSLLTVLIACSAFAQDSLNISFEKDLFESISNTSDMVIYGDYAYVVREEFPIFIMDMSDRENIHAVNSFDAGSFRYSQLFVYEHYLIITNSSDARAYDISDPVNPELIYTQSIPVTTLGRSKLDYPYLFVNRATFNLEVIDDWSEITLFWRFSAFDKNENIATLGTSDGHIDLYDVSDISSPELLSEINVEENFLFLQLTIHDNYLYAWGNSPDSLNLYVIDISTPSSPLIVSDNVFEEYLRCFTILTVNNIDYLAASSDFHLYLYEITDTGDLSSICSHNYNGANTVNKILQDENFLVLTGMGINYFDISNPSNPQYYCSDKHIFNPECIAQRDENVFIYDSRGQIKIFDFSTPDYPEIASIPTYATYEYPHLSRIEVIGNYLFIASWVLGNNQYATETIFSIYDIEDLENPVLIDERNMQSAIFTGTYNGILYFLTNNELSAYSFNDQGIYHLNTIEYNRINIGGQRHVDFNQGHMYISYDGYSSVLHVLNIEDYTNIYLENTVELGDGGGSFDMLGDDILAYDDLIFMTDGWSFLRILDNSNPGEPFQIAEYLNYSIPTNGGQLAMFGSTLAVAAEDGLVLYDYTSPGNIVNVAHYMFEGTSFEGYEPREIIEYNDHIYVLTETQLLEFNIEDGLECKPIVNTRIEDFKILSTYPNPFNSTVNIKMQLPQAENVRLELVNILGQIVQIQDLNIVNQGINTIPLHAENLASGTYLIKVSSGKQEAISKIQFLK